MSSEDKKQTESENGKPETLKDEDLDQVQGGYTEVEWTYAKGEQSGKWKVEEGESLKGRDSKTTSNSKIVASGSGI